MELSAVGESVFAAESIIKRRIRRVFAAFSHPQAVSPHLLRNHLLVFADRQSSDNPNLLRICFAGSLGISREMEGLVSEVSIIAEAVKDSAPSWPLVQLHHLRLSLFTSWMFFLLILSYLLCVP